MALVLSTMLPPGHAAMLTLAAVTFSLELAQITSALRRTPVKTALTLERLSDAANRKVLRELIAGNKERAGGPDQSIFISFSDNERKTLRCLRGAMAHAVLHFSV